MFLSVILERLAAWRRYRANIRELSNLSDRELDDIGVARFDIPRVAQFGAAR